MAQQADPYVSLGQASPLAGTFDMAASPLTPAASDPTTPCAAADEVDVSASPPPAWQLKADAKRQAREALIPTAWRLPFEVFSNLPTDVRSVPRTCGLLSPIELAITDEDDATVLAGRLAAGLISAVDVCRAFCKRAAVAHQVTNCLTEIAFDRALARAAELDTHLAREGTPVGPLHGLCISVKDQFDLAGFDSTMGFVSLISQPAARDAVLVEMLESLGAVVHCKTNVPQTLMVDETTNHVFGPTCNPRNTGLTAGGSSGGEGALVAMKGSILGVGTDFGGSIRKPSAYCGLHSLRPTSRRVPYAGAANVLQGAEAVESVAGPLARSFASIELFMRAIVGARPWELDAHTVDRPWMPDAELASRKLRVGIVWDDGMARNHPPVARGLAEAAAALASQGHKVVHCPPLDFAFSQRMMGRVATADGGADINGFLEASGEPLISEAFSPTAPTALTVHGYYALVQDRDAFRQRFLASWKATAGLFPNGEGPLDLILCACAPHLAPPPLGAPRPAELIVDTGMWSLLDLPACTLPVGEIDPNKDTICRSAPSEAKNAADCAHWDSYDPATFSNAPVVLQLISPRRFREDDLLVMASVAERALAAAPSSGMP